MKNIFYAFLILTSFQVSAQTNNYSLAFDGVDGYVEIPDDATLDFAQNNFTIFTWVKFNSIGLDESIIDHLPASGFYPRWNLRKIATGNLRLSMRDDFSNLYNADSDTGIIDLNWHFVALTFDYNSESTNFYLDGILVNSTVNQFGLTTGINPDGIVKIGKYGASASWTNGLFTNVAVWNIALDSNQIQYYMNCPPLGNEPGLMAYWDFEEGTGTIANDKTSNANNGTLFSGVTWSTDVPPLNCTSGINEYNSVSANIFPNPAGDNVTITLSEFYGGQIVLADALGKEVLRKRFASNKVVLETNKLDSKGFYFIKILDLSGNVLANKKLIYQ